MKELASKYNHLEVEANKNKSWIDNKYFQEHDLSKEPFCIVIPPPNVTGKLHIGHAWDTTLQDVIIRYKKLQGFNTLWVPGMDHAGIATQAKVDEKLNTMGISRYDIGREKFLDKAWEWKDEYADIIKEQWGKLGLALDYSKERFTLDAGLNDAVNHVFVELYNKGYIYQGQRIINWDPKAKTALSNIEVIHQDTVGYEHYFKYFFEDSNEYLTIMTTRPETMFGDGAIAVHPNDERYQHLVGKMVKIPISDIAIPIIADEYVDIDKGSGCVKITGAHDPNDFMVAKRNNIPLNIIMNEDGSMASTALVPEEFHNLDRFEARALLVEQTKNSGVLLKMDEINHNVGYSERTGVIVEPYLSKQWFVDMSKLAKNAIKYQESDEKITFYPERFSKTFLQWMEKIEDWCISRQLWWGHRIPVYYHKDTKEMYVSKTPPENIEDYIQDEDVLDTWFSSGLWPFSSLGWPNKTEDFETYYPNSVLVTGYDIIFFWVSRMIFMALEFTDTKPFENVLIHGLVRDSDGKKMSKSLGNGVDPMDVISKYGADSLRFFLSTNSTPGQDLRYMEEKVESTWNFINKLWNASRFVMMNIDDNTDTNIDIENLNPADKYILSRLNACINEVNINMDKYEYTNVGNELHNFIWDDYCSWYLEMAKATIDKASTKKVLKYVLEAILKMLHPFMPFVTEEIYQSLTNEKSIVLSSYPRVNTTFDFDNKAIIMAMELITKLREVRLEYEIKRVIELSYSSNLNLDEVAIYITKLTNSFNIGEIKSERSEKYILNNGLSIEVDLSMVVVKSKDELIEEYMLEANKLQQEIKRAEGMLSNEKFISKAPAEKVAIEQDKLTKFKVSYDAIQVAINELNK